MASKRVPILPIIVRGPAVARPSAETLPDRFGYLTDEGALWIVFGGTWVRSNGPQTPVVVGSGAVPPDVPVAAPAFGAGVTNYSAGAYRGLSFYKFGPEEIVIRGLVAVATAAATVTLFTLPVGWRPSVAEQFPATGYKGVTITPGVVQVGADGIVAISGTAASAWATCNVQVRFRIDA